MPGKEREELTQFLADFRDVAEHAKEVAAEAAEAVAEATEALGQAAPSVPPEVPVQAAPSELPDVATFTGKVLSTGLAEFITHTSSIANTFVQSSAAEISEIIGKELEATEDRTSTVSKSE